MDINHLINKYGILMDERLKSTIDYVESMQAKEISDGTLAYKELEFLKVKLYKDYVDDYEKDFGISLDKAYILLDNCVWNDEDYTKIVAISLDENIIRKTMKEYIEDTKSEIDFNNLNFGESDSEDYILNETEDSFILYQSGNYNSNHIDISIVEKELIKEEKKEVVEYGF